MSEILRVHRHRKDTGEVINFSIDKTDHYRRWWAQYGTPDLKAVYEHFGIEVFKRSSCLEGLDAFLTRCGFNGNCCIEIGTSNGLTAVVLSRHFKQVVSLDIEPSRMKQEIADYCEIKNIRFIDIKDNEEKARIIGDIEFDAAYSDGNHEHDAQSDFDMVKKCKRVLFHENWPLQPPIWELVNKLRSLGSVETHATYAIWRA